MAQLIILTEDGPLGAAGTQVWVDDPADAAPKKPPAKTAPKKPPADGDPEK